MKALIITGTALLIFLSWLFCFAQEEPASQDLNRAPKQTYPYMDWSEVLNIVKESNTTARIERVDGTRFWTNSWVRVQVASLAMASGEPLIVNWVSPSGYNGMYVGW